MCTVRVNVIPSSLLTVYHHWLVLCQFVSNASLVLCSQVLDKSRDTILLCYKLHGLFVAKNMLLSWYQCLNTRRLPRVSLTYCVLLAVCMLTWFYAEHIFISFVSGLCWSQHDRTFAQDLGRWFFDTSTGWCTLSIFVFNLWFCVTSQLYNGLMCC